ncbi:MAG: phage BR0599 family protein [Gammaproteobacteria bacterium]
MALVQYLIKEFSEQLGLPVLFYEFEMVLPSGISSSSTSSSSDNLVWRFCNQSFDIDWNGATWYASAIKLASRITQNAEVQKDSLQLKFPRDDDFAQMYVGVPPEFVTRVTIYRGHRTQPDEEYASYWRGRVAGCKASGNEIEISCESLFTSLRNFGLVYVYQRTCPHNVYDRRCKANLADFASSGVVDSATGYYVTAPLFATKPDGYWLGGILQTERFEMRYIIEHSSDTIKLWRPIQSILDDLADNIEVRVFAYPGCDKSDTTCRDVFNNIGNFVGFPKLPTRNPFDGRSIV